MVGGRDVDQPLFVGDSPGLQVYVTLFLYGLARGHAPESALPEEKVVRFAALDGHVFKAAFVLLDGKGEVAILRVQVFGHDGEVFPDVAVDIYHGSRHGIYPSLVWSQGTGLC